LRDAKDRVVLLETVWVDRDDVVALRRFSNLDGVDTVEEIDGPPDRRPSNTRGVDEFRIENSVSWASTSRRRMSSAAPMRKTSVSGSGYASIQTVISCFAISDTI